MVNPNGEIYCMCITCKIYTFYSRISLQNINILHSRKKDLLFNSYENKQIFLLVCSVT